MTTTPSRQCASCSTSHPSGTSARLPHLQRTLTHNRSPSSSRGFHPVLTYSPTPSVPFIHHFNAPKPTQDMPPPFSALPRCARHVRSLQRARAPPIARTLLRPCVLLLSSLARVRCLRNHDHARSSSPPTRGEGALRVHMRARAPLPHPCSGATTTARPVPPCRPCRGQRMQQGPSFFAFTSRSFDLRLPVKSLM